LKVGVEGGNWATLNTDGDGPPVIATDKILFNGKALVEARFAACGVANDTFEPAGAARMVISWSRYGHRPSAYCIPAVCLCVVRESTQRYASVATSSPGMGTLRTCA
jgi:hypothetical protein